MIGWLRGSLLQKHPPRLLLDVNGVGYELEAPMTTFYVLPELGQEVSLYTHSITRDDGQYLYAFASETDRDIFRSLLRVSGVGAKIALAILSGMDAMTFSRCVQQGDAGSLSRLPGIGKKTAERLVMEMADRLGGIQAQAKVAPGLDAARVRAELEPTGEAISALVALGFKTQEAAQRVAAVESDGLKCEEIVRRALQTLVK
jgi:Holliday junction DNA helicase RuvA